MTNTTLLAAVLLLWVSVATAAGQAVSGPPGSSGGLFGGHRTVDPNRVSQRLSLNVDLSGGYDSRGDTEGSGTGDANTPFQGLFAGTAQTGIRYWRGKSNRFLEGSARGRMNYESRTRQQLIGGEALVQGSSSLGRKIQLTGGGLVNYDPATLTSQFAPRLGDREAGFAIDHHPPSGIVQQNWVAGSAYVNLLRTWSVRQSTVVEYRATRRGPIDGPGLDSRNQEASMLHSWNFRPNAGVRLAYRFDDNRQATQTVVSEPLRTSTLDFGMQLSRRFSPIRTLNLEVAGGAALAERAASAELGSLNYVLPVVSGSLRFNLSGVWSLVIEGTRDISVLEGVTPEPFATQAGTLQLNAAVSNRVTFAVSGIYSKGAGLQTNTGSFETAQAQGQVQFGLGRCCGTFASYSFYNHRMRDLTFVSANFPERYTRHAIRAGFTFWLPLYGSF